MPGRRFRICTQEFKLAAVRRVLAGEKIRAVGPRREGAAARDALDLLIQPPHHAAWTAAASC